MHLNLYSIEQMMAACRVEHDWLFEQMLGKLNSFRNLFLIAEQGWGIKEYVHELGFQLAEKNPDIQTCFMDLRTVYDPRSFLDVFATHLIKRFPDKTSALQVDTNSMNVLKLPEGIAKRHKIRIAVFLGNVHLLQRFKHPVPFLRELKLRMKVQKNCVYCFYGNNNPVFRDLVYFPGPLSGLGRLYELDHKSGDHRSACIRKLFHDHNRRIGYKISLAMSSLMDNHPFYIRLLAWHALIMTREICTKAIVQEALRNLILHYDLYFKDIVESLTVKQLSFLKAMLDGNLKFHSTATREAYQLGASSNVTRIKNSLVKRQIIQIKRWGIFFTDPVFREWLYRIYFYSQMEFILPG